MLLKSAAFALAFAAPLAAHAAIGMDEASAILATGAKESGRPAYAPGKGVAFKAKDNVFLKSALAIDFTYRNATVTLPLFRGQGPSGRDTFFIVTEASDFDVARAMGVNFSPKLAKAAGSGGDMKVTVEGGVVRLPGDIDFGPEYQVTAGPADKPFPPVSFAPGARADANYSSAAVLPSGLVLNLQVVANETGRHDRATAVDMQARTVTMSLLDGMQNGKQYYYHLVTDVSADLPAVLEKGVFAPRLAKLPASGKSRPADQSALLGFSPVLNGDRSIQSINFQGFEASLANGGADPINVFPLAPRNDDRSASNNYSPMWDAHVNQWSAAAVKAGKVRRIKSLADLTRLVKAGDVEDAFINPPGAGNPYVAGLRPTGAIINCPVIAQPSLPPRS